MRTTLKSFNSSIENAKEQIKEELQEELIAIGNYAVQISPVWSGAFAESWSLRPRGSGGGRSRQSRKEKVPDVQAKKEEAKGLIAGDVAQYIDQILERGGATLNNRAPHAKAVDAKYGTVATVRDKFR